jgi:hypothetical protein
MAPSPPSQPRRRLVEILASAPPLGLPDALARLIPRPSSWCSPEGWPGMKSAAVTEVVTQIEYLKNP